MPILIMDPTKDRGEALFSKGPQERKGMGALSTILAWLISFLWKPIPFIWQWDTFHASMVSLVLMGQTNFLI